MFFFNVSIIKNQNFFHKNMFKKNSGLSKKKLYFYRLN